MPDTDDATRRARDAIDDAREVVLATHRAIHADPELGLEEVRSARRLVEGIGTATGVQAELGVGSLPTAVRAEAGSGELVITLVAEYDALPGIGHGCGHNVIAGAALGAFTGLAAVADELGITVRLLGTPAEENAGGKVTMLDEGAFDGTSAALMVHAAGEDVLTMDPFASAQVSVEFTGRESHASAAPHLGINALDALTVMLTAIGLNRQQLAPLQQVHGVVDAGGVAPNIIPGRAAGRWMARAADLESLDRVLDVVRRSAEAGAVATGAGLEITEPTARYADLRPDPDLSAFYADALASVGRTAAAPWPRAGSTDMGNVSQRFPSIHPMIGLGDPGVALHTVELTRLAGSEAGDRAVVDGATLLATTAIHAALTPGVRARLLRSARDGQVPPATS
ncbi:amidohydrolase [Auraticoccus monumenti]|uniref:Peptidase M20 domain-containing protein 2 n=1 Tax=Auraticoccus monumenti TaxID=675864 RepID=A0A1G6T3V6_9ACTN|nr:amidohydrolase [Auraticoccus monumenti]SDD23643.1 amidohydrolase [Auraticoccus monumenti]